jgi:cytochrome c biogenesis protein CcmG, thiol:disulfide interchange protein DsbE
VSATTSYRPDAAPTGEPSVWPARAIALGVAVVLLLFLALLIWGLGKRGEGTVGNAPIATRPAAQFKLPLFHGGTFDMAETRGTPVLINFWASWCIPCEDEAAVLERAARKYEGRVAFIGVAVQDTDENARAFIRKFGVTYPNGRDQTGVISVDYGMSGVPESFFVDRDGRLVRKWQGPLDAPRVDRLLQELLH